MRVAVVDIGTNSTRLLVAEVEDGTVTELERRSTVTRLGRGVDTSGQLAADAIEDVCRTVGEYIAAYVPLEPDAVTAIGTSAVRDAQNSATFLAQLRDRFALEARMLEGAEEAGLTYLGATSGRASVDGTLVIDIGGGSTELVFGSGPQVDFYASLQAGTVRHTERHLTTDPPAADDLDSLADDVRGLIDSELARADFFTVETGIAVAGTATSLAAIEQQLDPYDPELVHGFELSLDSIQHTLSMLASMTLEERLQVTGLPPGRAPTIVAGVVILTQVMRAFGLRRVEVSEHDILYGAALEAAVA